MLAGGNSDSKTPDMQVDFEKNYDSYDTSISQRSGYC